MIRNILLKHAGKYGCRAQTSADTVFAEAELLVRGEVVVCQCTGVLLSYPETELTLFSYWIIHVKFRPVDMKTLTIGDLKQWNTVVLCTEILLKYVNVFPECKKLARSLLQVLLIWEVGFIHQTLNICCRWRQLKTNYFHIFTSFWPSWLFCLWSLWVWLSRRSVCMNNFNMSC